MYLNDVEKSNLIMKKRNIKKSNTASLAVSLTRNSGGGEPHKAKMSSPLPNIFNKSIGKLITLNISFNYLASSKHCFIG